MSVSKNPPLPYFGSKRKAAEEVWDHLGDPALYVEPFAGSIAVLLARPDEPRMEVIADNDPWLINFWRCVRYGSIDLIDQNVGPVSDAEIMAWHRHLVARRDDLQQILDAHVAAFDPISAYIWWSGISSWIGSGWCREADPSKLPKQRPHIDSTLKGAHSESMTAERINWLSNRMRKVVCLTGDWKRGPSEAVLNRFRDKRGGVGVFLDPPYTHATGRSAGLYVEDSSLSTEVQSWALTHACAKVKVVVAGYSDEYPELVDAGWAVGRWKTPSGYVNKSGNTRRREEALFLSPH